jgi:hypothetical protein
MYELLHFLNFRHGLMVHINAYFACFINKHNIFEDLLYNLTLRNFIEKYLHVQCKVPDESSVRKNYVQQCYDLTIENIRDEFRNNFVGVSVNETQDRERRFIINIRVGSLSTNE